MRDNNASRPSRRYYFFHLGCPKNLVDAEMVATSLELAGWREADSSGDAELLVVTTCAFISMAEEESVDVILHAASIKKPWQKLAVLGCLVTREGDRLDQLLPEVDLFLSVAEMEELPERIGAGPGTNRDRAGMEAATRRLFTPSHIAYIKVAEGCSNMCSYCTIPSIRGGLRSRGAGAIIEEAEKFIRAGVKELVLIAQDTTAWGMERDLAADSVGCAGVHDIYDVAERIGRSGSIWVRLMYLHPKHIDVERTVWLLGSGSIIPYLDIPIQHASDSVLERMGRRYGRKRLLELFTSLRRAHPDLVLRTTVMTGFPGETEEDLEILIDFLEEIRFDHVGVFEFSPERGTPAAHMEPKIHPETVVERRDMLIELQMDISQDRLEQRINNGEKILAGIRDRRRDLPER
jgi:ribosomal protein S12 methylthiotransferase